MKDMARFYKAHKLSFFWLPTKLIFFCITRKMVNFYKNTSWIFFNNVSFYDIILKDFRHPIVEISSASEKIASPRTTRECCICQAGPRWLPCQRAHRARHRGGDPPLLSDPLAPTCTASHKFHLHYIVVYTACTRSGAGWTNWRLISRVNYCCTSRTVNSPPLLAHFCFYRDKSQDGMKVWWAV